MIRLIAFVFFIFCNSMLIPPLSALSIGRDGPSYIQDGIEWQNVYYKESDAGFTGTLPASPVSGISNGYVYCGSSYNNVFFEFQTPLEGKYHPPKTKQDFINECHEAFGAEASISYISPTQTKVKYCADIIFNDGNKIVRLFSSKNRLYWAIVEGPDLSLAPFVFDSFQVTR